MSKIICDVCGTSYQETANQCPICGCVRSADSSPVSSEVTAEATGNGSYTFVKGGRFSKRNVKKRMRGEQVVPDKQIVPDGEEEEKNTAVDKGLTIGIVVLILAIVAVSLYIALRFFGPGVSLAPKETTGANTTETPQTTELTTVATELEIPCDSIELSKTAVKFDKEGAALLLDVYCKPIDTTDEILFESSDSSVATVSEDGMITAVAPGEAVITVYCGDATVDCSVICDFEVETVETTEATEATEAETEPVSGFALNREDFTLNVKGEQWKLYNGSINDEEIYWTSDDEKVATVRNGVVTAVGKGYTTIRAKYRDTEVTCIVRCADSVGSYVEGDTGIEENVQTDLKYSISHSDVSIKINEVFDLILSDAEGSSVEVAWTVEDASVCSVSGNTVTGLAAGMTNVTATVDGTTYTCIVRVR